MIDKLNQHYSFTTPASVYDEEALTALELAGRQGAKINEVVDAQNQLQENTTKTLNQQNQNIDKMVNVTMPAKVDSEISKQINNGAFDVKINNYMGNLNERMDNLAQGIPTGGTTMDAEIVDARVGKDGTVYETLAKSIQGQSEQAQNDILEYFNTNLLDESKYVSGYLDPTSGVFHSDDQLKTSDFIRVEVGQRIICVDETLTPILMRFVTFYDANKNLVPWSGLQYGTTALTIHDGVTYIKVSINKATYPQKLMIADVSQVDFLDFGEYQIRNDVLPSEINVIREKAFYKDLYEPTTDTPNKYVSKDNGLLYELEGLRTTNYISVKEGQSLSVFNKLMEKQFIRMYALYDTNKNYVSGSENTHDIVIPANVAFIRLSARDEFLSDAIITDSKCDVYFKGGVVLSYDSLPSSDIRVASSMTGGHIYQNKLASLSDGYWFENFPYFLKKNACVEFFGKCGSFDSLTFGRGLSTSYCGVWVSITNNTVTLNEYTTATNILKTVSHGLNIQKFIHVLLDLDDEGVLTVTVSTLGGKFVFTHDVEGTMCGNLYAYTSTTMTDVQVNATCKDLSKPLWILGDSYLGMGESRVIGQLREYGFNDYLVSAQAGLGSQLAFAELKKLLLYGTPKTLVWCLGMNDSDSAYQTTLSQLVDLCKAYKIELIVVKVPTVPNISHESKNTFSSQFDVRFVDWYGAVGTNSTGQWYTGCLSGDNVHPTKEGAQILAMQLLVDVPEILSYGRKG